METKLVAEVIQRSQHSRGSSANMFGGPDCYVTLIVRPVDNEPVRRHPLSAHNIAKFGWTAIFIGEGYSKHNGPASKLGRCLLAAEREAEKQGAEIVERGVDYGNDPSPELDAAYRECLSDSRDIREAQRARVGFCY